MRKKVLFGFICCIAVISLSFNIILISKNLNLRTQYESNLQHLPPTIKKIELLGSNNENLMKDIWAKVPANGKLKIRIVLEGECSSIDIFYTPAGADMYLSQKIVASIDVENGQKGIEYIWQVPKDTRGYLNIMAYNNLKGTKSELYNVESSE